MNTAKRKKQRQFSSNNTAQKLKEVTITEVYPQPLQISKIELLTKTVTGFMPPTIFVKRFILDVGRVLNMLLVLLISTDKT